MEECKIEGLLIGLEDLEKLAKVADGYCDECTAYSRCRDGKRERCEEGAFSLQLLENIKTILEDAEDVEKKD